MFSGKKGFGHGATGLAFYNASGLSRKEIFDRQVERLLNLGAPKLARINEQDFLAQVLPLMAEASSVKEVPIGHIPFVIVLPHFFIPRSKQIRMISYQGQSCASIENLERIVDSFDVAVLGFPYLAIDIEPGLVTLCTPTRDAVRAFNLCRRSGLTLDEGIALAVHFPELLTNLNIDLPGSCNERGTFPSLCLSGGRPSIDCVESQGAENRFGAASCAKRYSFWNEDRLPTPY